MKVRRPINTILALSSFVALYQYADTKASPFLTMSLIAFATWGFCRLVLDASKSSQEKKARKQFFN